MKSEAEIKAMIAHNEYLLNPATHSALSGDQKRKLELENAVLKNVLGTV